MLLLGVFLYYIFFRIGDWFNANGGRCFYGEDSLYADCENDRMEIMLNDGYDISVNYDNSYFCLYYEDSLCYT